jgi:phage shock protein PspC (stress-responsive transcriptional regulator)
MVPPVVAEESGAMPENPPATSGATQYDDAPPSSPPPPPPPPGGSGPGSGPGPEPGGPTGGRDGWDTDALTDYRRLRRSRDDRKIAGVAGGLARHLDVDPLLLRVLLVVLVFFGGAGIVLYTALWLFVPEEGTEKSVVSVSDSTRNVLVLLTAALAVILVLGDAGGGVGVFWPPLVLVLIGVFVWLMVRDNKDRQATAQYGPPATPGSWTPAPGALPPGAVAPGGAPPGAMPPGGVPPGSWTPAPARPPRPRKRSGPLLFGATLALVAVGLGILGLVEATGTDVVDAAYPALALALVGVMLVVGSVFGRPGGLILVGLVLSLGLAATSLAEPRFDGDRDLLVRPTQADQLGSSYDVPAGRVEVDLTRIDDLDELDGRNLVVESNAGEIVVVVPDGLAVEFGGDIDYGGAIETPFGNRDGWDVTLSGRVGDSDDPTLHVDTFLDFGHIELRQS